MRPTLVFDSDCGSCTSFKSAISFLDARRRIRYVGLDVADMEGLLDSIPPDLRRRSFHLICPGGNVKSGAAAFSDLARLLPAGRPSAALLERSPPVSRGAAWLYSVLSRLHDTGACRRPRQEPASTSMSTSLLKTWRSRLPGITFLSGRGLASLSIF